MRNKVDLDNSTLRRGERLLRARLPQGWRLEEVKSKTREDSKTREVDLVLRVVAPDRTQRLVTVEAKARVDPRDVLAVRYQLRDAEDALLISPYLSPSTRAQLQEAKINYLDLTGNVRIEISRPGLFIDTGGADVAPDAVPRGSRSLRGDRAGRVIRYLIDHREVGGVRRIAAETAVDPGYVSRVLALLDRELLIERAKRGKIVDVKWEALLRRWAEESPLAARGAQVACLAPRGPASVLDALQKRENCFITGSFAASKLAPVSASRVLTFYATDPTVAVSLGLRDTDRGANVLVIQPSDPSVLLGARVVDGARHVAVSQVAVDLLGGTGREPSEGDALIEWMKTHEENWRG